MKTTLVTIFAALASIALLTNTMIEESQADQENIFIWNDTEESIPADGELVKIEFSEGNTIYLAPLPDYGLKPEYVIELQQDSAYIQTEERLYIVHVRDIQKTIEEDNL